ncbi:MAG TPA: hypothetical protein VFS55_06470 [Dokdonella sp.]|nr:hypothetical protein [Dokdonella sp.]
MNEPSARTRDLPTEDPRRRGSLLAGVAWAWALLIGGHAVVVATYAGSGYIDDGTGALLVALPWLSMIGLIIWFVANGRPRSALGVLLGIGTIVAVALLLVAACFGLLSSSGWH